MNLGLGNRVELPSSSRYDHYSVNWLEIICLFNDLGSTISSMVGEETMYINGIEDSSRPLELPDSKKNGHNLS